MAPPLPSQRVSQKLSQKLSQLQQSQLQSQQSRQQRNRRRRSSKCGTSCNGHWGQRCLWPLGSHFGRWPCAGGMVPFAAPPAVCWACIPTSTILSPVPGIFATSLCLTYGMFSELPRLQLLPGCCLHAAALRQGWQGNASLSLPACSSSCLC